MNKAIELNSTVWMLIGFMIFGIISSLIAAIVRNIVLNVLKYLHMK